MKHSAPDGFWIVPCAMIWALIVIILLVLAGCAPQRDPMWACKPPARPITHWAWGETCFWPEPPRRPA